MKLESRGKYPGVKVHLEPDECEMVMDLARDLSQLKMLPYIVETGLVQGQTTSWFTVVAKMGKKMLALLKEHPDMLTERTPDQVKAALLKDQGKIEKQLAAGADWQKVKG